MARYLEGLPRGLASYPRCVNKASLLRSAIDDHPLHDLPDGTLPAALAELARDLPPVSTWIPAVHDNALKLAIYDRYFGDPTRYKRFVFDAQLALFSGPLYRFAMRTLGPRRLVRRAPERFAHFHRGTPVTMERVEDTLAILLHESPPGLYDDLSYAGFIEGIRAALTNAGAREISITRERVDDHHVRLIGRWS